MSATLHVVLNGKLHQAVAGDLQTTMARHDFNIVLSMLSGTTSGKIDRLWSDTRTANAAADTLDLTGGGLLQADGSTFTLARLQFLLIRNKSSSYNLELGDAASNPVSGLFEATTHRLEIKPGGVVLMSFGSAGLTISTDTADILQLDPGANSVDYDIWLAGRSAAT